MSKPNNTSEIQILGQKIALKPTGSDPELAKQVIDLATKKLAEAEKRGKGAAAHQVAILALLDLAEEYLKAKQRTIDYKKQVGDRSKTLLNLIEAELK